MSALIANKMSDECTSYMYRDYFDSRIDHFALFNQEHVPQSLTESNKDGTAYRKGIYITNVEEKKDGTHFHVLRCSSNLRGPTDNLRDTDRKILHRLNATARQLYKNPAELNHVLAQIYYNQMVDGKDRKARIAKHSDKTKDMPKNGLIVFCTFYEGYVNGQFTGKKYDKTMGGDLMYKGNSVLTKLVFKLKPDVSAAIKENYPDTHTVKLYPNSVLFTDLEINRLYTHEISPPVLHSGDIPVRLGYVVRSSNVLARHDAINCNVHIRENIKENTAVEKVEEDKKVSDVEKVKDDCSTEKVEWTLLEKPTAVGMAALKKQYAEENFTSVPMKYNPVDFSLNDGDYLKPNL